MLWIFDDSMSKDNMKTRDKIGYLYFSSNGPISALSGIGGGTLSVPYLSFIINDIKKSIATASAIGLIIAITSLIYMFILNASIYTEKLNHLSLLILIPSSILGSYTGVLLLKIIDPEKVKNIFSALLIVVAFYLLID